MIKHVFYKHECKTTVHLLELFTIQRSVCQYGQYVMKWEVSNKFKVMKEGMVRTLNE